MSKAPRVAIQQEWDRVAGLSTPSKMPCYGYSLPANRCITGSKLRQVAGSTCSGCYAMKGNYVWPDVARALERRFNAINEPTWIDDMVALIAVLEKSGYFRWHDSGDIQSVAHLSAIVEIAKRTPDVEHWLPTREYRIVNEWRKANGAFPSNLCVRLSAHMLGKAGPTQYGLPVSGVAPKGSKAFDCQAYTRGGKCGDCRACWDVTVPSVIYPLH